MTLNDLEPQNRNFSDSLRFLPAEAWIATKCVNIHEDNLQTGTARAYPLARLMSISSDFLF